MVTYAPAAGPPGRSAASVPIQKRVIPAKPTFPAPSAGPGMGIADPPKAWPPAPEQPPQFSPQTHPLYPPAPVAPIWPTAPTLLVPSSFGVGASETGPISAPAAHWIPGAVVPAPASLAPMPEHAPWPTPVEQPHPLAALRQGATQVPGSRPEALVSPPGGHDGNPMASERFDSEESGWSPARDERNVPLGLFLLLVMAGLGWLAWQMARPGMVAEFAAPRPPALQGAALPAVTPDTPTAGKYEVEPPTALSAPNPPQQSEEAKAETRSTAPVLDLVAAKSAAAELLEKLFRAGTLDERLKRVAEGEDHRAQIAEFFQGRSVTLKSLGPAAVVPRSLPGQELVPLMDVKTNLNAESGARLQLVAQTDGSFLLGWTLFEETHEKGFEKFLASRSDEPVWLSVLVKRTHGVELTEAVRQEHFCVALEGSEADASRCLAVVPLETPLARFFEREVEWGEVYVSRLLLQHREVVGKREVVILDCEGAVTGAIFPSGPARP